MTEEKHTKVATKLYVEHACNFISTNQLATLLNIEPSRVSEMKSGRRRLTIEEGEIIRAEFGLPETSKGIYMEAELLNDDWYEVFLKNGELFLYQNISQYVASPEFRDLLYSSFLIDTRHIENYEHDIYQYPSDERKGQEHKNKRLEEEKKLDLINQLMVNQTFHHWYAGVEQARIQDNSLNDKEMTAEESQLLSDIMGSIETGFVIKREENLPKINFIAGAYKLMEKMATNDSPISFGKISNISSPTIPVAEYVINGSEVWCSDVTIYAGLDDLRNLAKPVTQHENPDLPSGRTYPAEIERLKLTQDRFKNVHFALIYTEKHDYYLKVTLSQDALTTQGSRTLLIKIQDRRDLFGELERIFDVFRLNEGIDTSLLKAELAKNGAYIPSVIYLN